MVGCSMKVTRRSSPLSGDLGTQLRLPDKTQEAFDFETATNNQGRALVNSARAKSENRFFAIDRHAARLLGDKRERISFIEQA